MTNLLGSAITLRNFIACRACRLKWLVWDIITGQIRMDVAGFQASIIEEKPPARTSLALQSLWHVAKGDWETAHKVALEDKSASGAWVHAYLHRVDGNLSNAGYWYRKAGRPKASSSLQDEWQQIAKALL
tara:strand:- start:460 stop:849 length:390 start_codon:yes stop_codon:yes gene_type:complete